ncbi:MAG: phospholipid carrier-dependent glycosyltransferase [Verrucomicrobia bacterium]|nr:phospholipid carrier-dependent glycosyltransferase [Verrucomicrobiota bacterium]
MGSKRTRRKTPKETPVVEIPPPEPAPPEERRAEWKWIGVLTLAAFVVRMIALGRADLWGDEILFATRSTPPLNASTILQMTWEQLLVVTHLPLPRIIQNLFLWIFYSEGSDIAHNAFLQRIPSVLWGTLTVPVFGVLCFRLLRRRLAITATMIMAFSLFPVFFSREAYYYAPLMFFATSSLALLAEVIEERRLSTSKSALLLLSNIGLVASHLTGNIILLILLLAMLVETARIAAKEGRAGIPASTKRSAAFCALPYLVVSPFLHKLATHPTQLRFPPGPSMAEIIYDLVGKVFAGNVGWANVLAAAVFVIGIISFWRERDRSVVRRYVLIIGVVGTLVLAFSASSTQYASRYFASLISFFVLIVVAGLDGLARLLAWTVKPLRQYGDRVFLSLAGAFLAVHVLLFLPLYYPLSAKGTNYGAVSKWLNEHLAPGAPYLVESAYQLRFISGYFPTPGLVPASPFVHHGPEQLPELRESHRKFLLQFPESPWIETARHGQLPGEELGSWTWPHRHFRQRVDIKNGPLRRMSNLGIWIQQYGSRAHDNTLSTPIWYNKDEDIDNILREGGQRVRLLYPGWNCAQIQQGTYGRISPAYPPEIRVRNLTGESVKGRFKCTAALLAPAVEIDTLMEYEGRAILQTRQWGGRLWTLDSEPVQVEPGEHGLTWKVSQEQLGSIQGMVIVDIQFVEE